MSKVAIQGNASGTGTFTIAAPNSNTDRTLTLPDEAGTVLTSASDIPAGNLTGNVTQNSGECFHVYKTYQTISSSTQTLLTFDGVSFNAGSAYNTSTYRFTPTIAGYYRLASGAYIDSSTASFSVLSIYKNGSFYAEIDRVTTPQTNTVSGSTLVEANGTTDYFEVYYYSHTAGSTLGAGGSQYLWFDGNFVRAS